ncbi:hypothetical protein EYF80_033384 [Liparis tanakae]|uniref:Uncharacterized protein n=1 Tax=Liparis tanakae TaxID=230148 RepID=A0A4Z2GUK0_9TELE|nr:hypothetical protein EYF80_033384 [Liparis tanakae]
MEDEEQRVVAFIGARNFFLDSKPTGADIKTRLGRESEREKRKRETRVKETTQTVDGGGRDGGREGERERGETQQLRRRDGWMDVEEGRERGSSAEPLSLDSRCAGSSSVAVLAPTRLLWEYPRRMSPRRL